MYKYPSNLRESAKLGLWTLKDTVVITIAILLSILILTKTGTLVPLVLAGAYATLCVNLEGVSIKDYLIYIFRFCVSSNQYFEWGL